MSNFVTLIRWGCECDAFYSGASFRSAASVALFLWGIMSISAGGYAETVSVLN
jgi:hypothetical protein